MQYIIYVTGTSLQVYNNRSLIATLPFPEKSVVYQEVLDEDKLIEGIKAFLQAARLPRGKAGILLSDQLVFVDQVAAADKEAVKKKTESFFHYVPLHAAKRAQKILAEKNVVYLIAANQDLFMTIKKGFEGFGWEIQLVAPGNLFGITDANMATITKAVSHPGILQKANLLSETHVPVEHHEQSAPEETHEEAEPKKGTSKRTYLMLAASVACLILVSVIAYTQFNTSSKPSQNARTQTRATAGAKPAKPSIVLSAAPTTSYKDKKEIAINVINGSGVVGQAGKIRDLLATDGYVTITIGTGQTTASGSSKLTVQNTVSPEIQKELKTLLETVLTEVEIESATESADTLDITIVTNK